MLHWITLYAPAAFTAYLVALPTPTHMARLHNLSIYWGWYLMLWPFCHDRVRPVVDVIRMIILCRACYADPRAHALPLRKTRTRTPSSRSSVGSTTTPTAALNLKHPKPVPPVPPVPPKEPSIGLRSRSSSASSTGSSCSVASSIASSSIAVSPAKMAALRSALVVRRPRPDPYLLELKQFGEALRAPDLELHFARKV